MTESARVLVEPGGADLDVKPGESVFEVARREGYRWPTSCQGQGSCRMCFMSVLEGQDIFEDVCAWEAEGLEELGQVGVAGAPVRLACQATVCRPGRARVFKRGVRKTADPTATADSARVGTT